MRKQTNTLSPSPKWFQSLSPRTSEKSADSDVRKDLTLTSRLGSVAGPVIQATGKSIFEDGLKSGGAAPVRT
jgi:hypothetical protein